MTLRFDPPYVPIDGKLILSWQLDNSKTIADTQLTMELPADMVPEGMAASYYNPETRKLAMNLAGTSGQIPLAVDPKSPEKDFPIFYTLMVQEKAALTGSGFLSRIEEYSVSKAGGTLSALGEALKISFSEGSAPEDLQIYPRYLSAQEGGSTTVNGGRFFVLTAKSQETGAEIKKFNQPLGADHPISPDGWGRK